MGKLCADRNCRKSESTVGGKRSFFSFPKDPHILKMWMNNLNLPEKIPKLAVACSEHFLEGDIVHTGRYPCLRSGAVPVTPDHLVTHVVSITVNCNQTAPVYVHFENKKIELRLKYSEQQELPTEFYAEELQSSGNMKSTTTTQVLTCTTVSDLAYKRHEKKCEKNKILRTELQIARYMRKKSSNLALKWKAQYKKLLNHTRTNLINDRTMKKRIKMNSQKIHGHYRQRLRSIFTENQINVLLNRPLRPSWTPEELSIGLCIWKKTNAYSELLKRKFPFPSVRALQRSKQKIQIQPGILECVLDLLKLEFEKSSPLKKQCILAFDEMTIDKRYQYDIKTDRAIGGKTYLQVFIVRGLAYDWKQVVSFQFDQNIKGHDFLHLITKIERTGLRIRGVVSDMGGKNTSLWKSLGVGAFVNGNKIDIKNRIMSPEFEHEIFFFADAPHLLKNFRNSIINHTVHLDGGRLSKEDLRELVAVESESEIKECWKITPRHLELSTLDKMNVRLAVQTISSETAAHFRKVFPNRLVEAAAIEAVSNCFKVFSSRHLNEQTTVALPYGLALEEQEYALSCAENLMLNMRIKRNYNVQDDHEKPDGAFYPFQKGFLLSITSLRELRQCMKTEFNAEYIFGSHCSQDLVENFFSQIRSMRGLNKNPTGLDVIERIKILMLCSSTSISRAANVDQDGDFECITATRLAQLMKRSQKADNEEAIEISSDPVESVALDVDNYQEITNNLDLKNDCEHAALQYVAGRVAFKLKRKLPSVVASGSELEVMKSSWIASLKKPDLTFPSLQLWNEVNIINIEFQRYFCTKSNLTAPGAVKGLSKALSQKYRHMSPDVIHAFLLTRFSIHLQQTSQKLNDKKLVLKNKLEERRFTLNKRVNDKKTDMRTELDGLYTSCDDESNIADLISIYDCDEFSWSLKVKESVRCLIGDNPIKGLQKAAINALLTGQDVVAVLGTGFGKSLIYQVVGLVLGGLVVVVSPLIVLIEDQVKFLKSTSISAFCFTTGIPDSNVMDSVRATECSFLFVTPEKLSQDLALQKMLTDFRINKRLSLFAVDEAHCYTEFGFSFRTDYLFLRKLKTTYENVPIVCLTATATIKTIHSIKEELSIQQAIVIRGEVIRENLTYSCSYVYLSSKDEEVLRIITSNFPGNCGIVYCLSPKDCTALSKFLNQGGLSSAAYYADLHTDKKAEVLEKWKNGIIKIVVATVSFGLGVNKSDCRFVIHRCIPKNVVGYVQETGRAGRDNCIASCILLLSSEDVFRVLSTHFFEENSYNDIREMLEYCLSVDKCRNSMISEYFKKRLELKGPCKCDNCNRAEDVTTLNISDVVKSIVKILEVSESKRMKVTPKKLVDILSMKSRDSHFKDLVTPRTFSKVVLEQIVLKAFIDEIITIHREYGDFKTVCYVRRGIKSQFVGEDYVMNVV